MYTKISIGDRIKLRRKELGMSQKKLAAKINGNILPEEAPHTQISQWEKGSKTPETDALIRLCNALDCDIDFLLGAIEAPKKETSDVMKATGLSKEAVNMLQNNTWNEWYINFISFILESNMVLPVIGMASKCVEARQEIEHLRKDVLPNLQNEEDKRKAYKDLKELDDIYTAYLWRCSKDAEKMISAYIDKEVQNG